MKKILNILLFGTFGTILLNFCGVTYKKKKILQDLEKLVKKEAKQESKAYTIGRTLYLDMQVN
jgi:hypothetical protein